MSTCGPTSQCKTKRCPCKSNGENCEPNCSVCKCNGKICSNKSNESDSDDNDDKRFEKKPVASGKSFLALATSKLSTSPVQEPRHVMPKKQLPSKKTNYRENENIDEEEANALASIRKEYNINDLAGEITQIVRLPVTKKKDTVFSHRNDMDIYTNKSKDEVVNPQVDHIVEDQIVGHAAANALKGNQAYQPYVKAMQAALNLESCDNYNVTFQTINGSKGAIIKSYLRDNMNRGFPLRSLIKPESHFGKNMELIFQAMNETYPIVANSIAEGRRSDGHVTGRATFMDISEEIVKTFSEMDLDINSGRRLRSRKN